MVANDLWLWLWAGNMSASFHETISQRERRKQVHQLNVVALHIDATMRSRFKTEVDTSKMKIVGCGDICQYSSSFSWFSSIRKYEITAKLSHSSFGYLPYTRWCAALSDLAICFDFCWDKCFPKNMISLLAAKTHSYPPGTVPQAYTSDHMPLSRLLITWPINSLSLCLFRPILPKFLVVMWPWKSMHCFLLLF